MLFSEQLKRKSSQGKVADSLLLEIVLTKSDLFIKTAHGKNYGLGNMEEKILKVENYEEILLGIFGLWFF